ncbi:unnamed protein product [Caenorhabditis bovis]|uniref:Galectin n=1 Tax=Caenorhabditis bovis TaxID=2654633 RepID=A0A8S1F0X7_9PELO|nr:unnamed protein product [Caenorhabditis bovis]
MLLKLLNVFFCIKNFESLMLPSCNVPLLNYSLGTVYEFYNNLEPEDYISVEGTLDDIATIHLNKGVTMDQQFALATNSKTTSASIYYNVNVQEGTATRLAKIPEFEPTGREYRIKIVRRVGELHIFKSGVLRHVFNATDIYRSIDVIGHIRVDRIVQYDSIHRKLKAKTKMIDLPLFRGCSCRLKARNNDDIRECLKL